MADKAPWLMLFLSPMNFVIISEITDDSLIRSQNNFVVLVINIIAILYGIKSGASWYYIFGPLALT